MEAENKTTMKWVLCSLRFEDIVQIIPKELNIIPIESNYGDKSIRHVKKTHFNHFQYLDRKTMKEYNATANQIPK